MADPPLNPYAVTVADDRDESPEDSADGMTPADGSFDPSLVGTTGVILGAIGSTTAAGAIFGFVFSVVLFLAVVVSSASQPGSFVFVGGFLAISVGGISAMLASFPSVLLLYAASYALRRPSGRWSPPTVRLVNYGTGALSGFLTVVVISGFDAVGLLVGFIPATVGALVAGFFSERKIRRANHRQRTLNERRRRRVASDSPKTGVSN